MLASPAPRPRRRALLPVHGGAVGPTDQSATARGQTRSRRYLELHLRRSGVAVRRPRRAKDGFVHGRSRRNPRHGQSHAKHQRCRLGR